jgi:hypothetical protein
MFDYRMNMLFFSGCDSITSTTSQKAKLQRVRELGISDELNLQLFETLLQRVCVYDFFVERGKPDVASF